MNFPLTVLFHCQRIKWFELKVKNTIGKVLGLKSRFSCALAKNPRSDFEARSVSSSDRCTCMMAPITNANKITPTARTNPSSAPNTLAVTTKAMILIEGPE
jgi:hypothetical protein